MGVEHLRFADVFSVNHTCVPSGVAAMLGQNGLSCFTRPTIW